MTALKGIVGALESVATKPIVEQRGHFFTGGDLLQRIRARSADLQQAGVKAGDTVLIVVSDNVVAIEQLVACWWLGAAGCLVDFRLPSERIAEWQSRLTSALVLGVRPISGTPVHIQPQDPSPTADLLPELPGNTDTCAIVFASSGSTGLPSLLPITQGRLKEIVQETISEAEALGVWTAYETGGAMLSATSVGYSASGFKWLRNLSAARSIVSLDIVHRLEELDLALKRPDVVECSLPPSTIRSLAALPGDCPRYPQLHRLISVGGPAMPEDKLAAVKRLSPFYVMIYSCVGVGLISRITGAEVLERPASCGRPLASVKVEIKNGHRLCSPGEIGEIVVTTERVSERRVGDIGWLDEAGYLYVVGRRQGYLCRNGVNFSDGRLTEAALALTGVTDAVVVVLPDADGGDEIHLVVQAAADLSTALKRQMRRALPAIEQPDRLHIWDALPLLAGGKVDRQAILERLQEDGNGIVIRKAAKPDPDGDVESPRSATGRR
jgi:acyl-coenzyme A synthetase/AMP-(fatty) acid ligase